MTYGTLAVACAATGAVAVETSTATVWFPTAVVPGIVQVAVVLNACTSTVSSRNRYWYVAPTAPPDPAAMNVTGVPKFCGLAMAGVRVTPVAAGLAMS